MARKRKKKRALPWDLGLPLAGVDHHAHLDLEDFSGEVDDILERAARAGVARVGNVFLGPEAYRKGKALFDHHPEVFFVVGAHPNEINAWGEAEETDLRQTLLGNGRIKALGEIGLDFYWDKVPVPLQEKAFISQLALARDLGLPVVLHCREAEERALDILAAEGYRDRPLVWHCFGRDADMARRIVDMGWHVSVPGPVTWRKAETLAQAVAAIPLDRLMVETDCPFLAPDPWRGKRNEPAYAAFTAAKMAEIKGLAPAELWQTCAHNAARFFALDT